MRRVSFGLESGSQRMLDLMEKGCSVETNAEFIRNACEAGISVRCTMFKGFPGETAADLEQTADFLTKHSEFIDRIRFNEFSILEGTPIHDAVREEPSRFPELRVLQFDQRQAAARYVNSATTGSEYRRAKARVLALVHQINRREVRRTAQAFDGLM
jgi:radical SAM superfamily enzyme YgiQ (UPF0313 family)